jgi:hypothetical protein
LLLDVAAAPPSVEELAGERAAVARFVAAYRDAAPIPPASRRAPPSRSARMAIKVAAGVPVLAVGGTAVAAETGNLPGSARQFLTGLGVPVPAAGSRPTASGTGHTLPSMRPAPAVTPAPPLRGATTTGPAEIGALDLCRSWDAARTNPHGKAVPAATRQALADLAGGEHRIAAFCDDVLSGSPSGSTVPSLSAKGNGKDKKDKSREKTEPRTTPAPKDKR